MRRGACRAGEQPCYLKPMRDSDSDGVWRGCEATLHYRIGSWTWRLRQACSRVDPSSPPQEVQVLPPEDGNKEHRLQTELRRVSQTVLCLARYQEWFISWFICVIQSWTHNVLLSTIDSAAQTESERRAGGQRRAFVRTATVSTLSLALCSWVGAPSHGARRRLRVTLACAVSA